VKRLFYIRHAETEMNVAEIFSGQIETNLTHKGKQQAIMAGGKLKTQIPHIDLIVCSPLSRTHETAKIVAGEIGYTIDNIELCDLLLERSFGVLEGTSGPEYMKNHERHEIDSVLGAESIEQLQARAEKAFEYVKSLPQENILVVSHGTFGRAFRRVIQGLPHTQEYLTSFPIANAEILELI
jgi:broad specificity phosphatase PhoE